LVGHIAVGLATLALLGATGTASADPGGVPHGSPDTCGVGKAETAHFIADPTLPGVGESSMYPPVVLGCTGKPS
jgi:hypothetical protein